MGVYSTAGLLFGYRMNIDQAYAFPRHVTPGAPIFGDEIHTLIERYASNSLRQRTFGQATTAMRKEQITCLGASADSEQVGWEYKRPTEWIMAFRRWYPRKYEAPDFCYVEVVMRGPYPYRRRDPIVEQMLGYDDSQIIEKRFYPNPQELRKAALLMDSHESIKLGEAYELGSAEMRESLAGSKEVGGDRDERADVFYYIHGLVESGGIHIENVDKIMPWATVTEAIKRMFKVEIGARKLRANFDALSPLPDMSRPTGLGQKQLIEWIGRTRHEYVKAVEGEYDD